MRSKRRQKSVAGVSLFPFLAVLLCTMGAMILVLVVIARQAQVDSEQEASSIVPSPDSAKRREMSEAIAWNIEQLRESRRKTDDELSERRLELSHLEDHARELREQMKKLETQSRELANHRLDKNADLEDLRAELALIREQVSESKAEVERLEKERANKRESYAILPFEGQNGTRRRPIYIECRADAVILRPEGIELTDRDFAGPLGPGNPLASALRATREYLARSKNARSEGEPYPLLLVRPDGINSYYAARNAMLSWGSEFGYELIEADWKLDFEAADPRLAEIQRIAVAEGRQREILLASMAPRGVRPGEHVEFRASPTGGITQVEDSRPTRATAEEAAARERAIARRSIPDDPEPDGFAWRRGGSAGGASGETQGPLPYGEALAQNETRDRYTRGAAFRGESDQDGPDFGDPRSSSSVEGAPVEGIAARGRFGDEKPGIVRGPEQDSQDQDSLSGEWGEPFASNPDVAPGRGGDGSGSSRSNREIVTRGVPNANGSGAGDDPSGRVIYRTDATGSTSWTAESRGSRSKANASANPGEPERASDSGPAVSERGSNRFAKSRGVAGRGNSKQGQSTDREDASSNAAGAAGQSTASRAGARGASRGASGANAASTASASVGGASSPPTGAANGAAVNASAIRSIEPIADRKGKNWALRNEAGSDVPVVREIELELDQERLVFLPAGRDAKDAQVVELGDDTQDSIEEFSNRVNDRVDRWGTAGEGNHWRPTLKVFVLPRGEERFRELRDLLRDSGWELKRAPAATSRFAYPRTPYSD